jgi:hypothetical protein
MLVDMQATALLWSFWFYLIGLSSGAVVVTKVTAKFPNKMTSYE